MTSTLEVSRGHAPDLSFPRGYDWKLTVVHGFRGGEKTIVHTGWRVSEVKAFRAAARELKKCRKALDALY